MPFLLVAPAVRPTLVYDGWCAARITPDARSQPNAPSIGIGAMAIAAAAAAKTIFIGDPRLVSGQFVVKRRVSHYVTKGTVVFSKASMSAATAV
jgi:hypothetical protein